MKKTRLLIAVPTRNRSKSFKTQTYRYLPFLGIDYKIFMEESQLPKYDYLNQSEVVTFKKEGLGLGYALQKVKEYAVQNGYDFIFKMDDDIVNWRGLDKRVPKGDNTAGLKIILNKLCNESIKAFDNIPKVGGVSIHYGNELYENLKTWYGENQRMQTCYIIRTKLYEPNTKADVFEDFDTTLSIIANGYKILRYGKTAMNMPAVGTNAGGIQDFNRYEKAKLAILYFKNKYGNELKIKPKPEKQWKIEPILNSYAWYKTKKFI